MKAPNLILITLATLGSAFGDVERFTLSQTDSLTLKSEDGSAILKVEIERFKRDQIKTTGEGKNFAVWHGKRQLPFNVLMIPTMIKDLKLSIDGKNITIPKNFWNDIGGLQLKKILIDPARPIKTPEDNFKLADFISENSRSFPTLSRTPRGSTVLITWVRPEE